MQDNAAFWRELTSLQQEPPDIDQGLDALAKDYGNAPSEETKKNESSYIICMDTIQEEKVSFIWRTYIPLGKICDIMGDPGNGKTFFSCALAAAVSTGGGFPSDEGFVKCEQGNVIFQTCEDGLGDTLKPRLRQSGADFSRIFIIDEAKEGLTLTDIRLEKALKEIRPKLIIIDPLQGYLGAGVDMHRANEIRPIMAHIGRLASEYNCAIILVTHMSKAGQDRAIYKGLGSIDIAAAARSILMVGRDIKTGNRAIAHVKSSLAAAGPSIGFELSNENGFLWKGISELTADDLLSTTKSNNGEGERAIVEAKEYILGTLAEGPLFSGKIYEDGIACGFSKRTLERAKDELRTARQLVIDKKGYGGKWQWDLVQSLP